MVAQQLTPKLSVEAAKSVQERMNTYALVVVKQKQVLDNAMLDIEDALQKMRKAEAAYDELAKQLDVFAPEGFGEQNESKGFDPTAPSLPSIPSPFPPAPPAAWGGAPPSPFPPAPPAAWGGAPPVPYPGRMRPWHKKSDLPKRTYGGKLSDHMAQLANAPSWVGEDDPR